MKSLSWSELWLFEDNFDAWYSRYVAGISERGTAAMERGTQIHEMLQRGSLDTENLDKGEIRVQTAILKGFEKTLVSLGMPREEMEWEKMVVATVQGIPTIGFWDGRKKGYAKLEIKTGSSLWDKKRAQEHGQLMFYDLQELALGEPLTPFVLFTANTTNGKTDAIWIEHTPKELQAMRERINRVWEAMAPYHEIRTKTLVEV